MSSNLRLLLGGSLVLNAILIVVIIFMSLNRPDETRLDNGAIAQTESTAVVPTQTPLIVTVVTTIVTTPTAEPTIAPIIVVTETAVPQPMANITKI